MQTENVSKKSEFEERLENIFNLLFGSENASFAYKYYFRISIGVSVICAFLVAGSYVKLLASSALPFEELLNIEVYGSFSFSIVFLLIKALIAFRGLTLLNRGDVRGVWYGLTLAFTQLFSYSIFLSFYGAYALFDKRFQNEKLTAAGPKLKSLLDTIGYNHLQPPQAKL